ncbi:hypothetical protein B4903_05365 [Yersinia frederiksenii]|nr:hypothetical protein B4903_05365 [Yersinia frederiksenii]
MHSIITFINILSAISAFAGISFAIVQIIKSRRDIKSYKERLIKRKSAYETNTESLKQGYGIDNEHD